MYTVDGYESPANLIRYSINSLWVDPAWHNPKMSPLSYHSWVFFVHSVKKVAKGFSDFELVTENLDMYQCTT